MNARTLVEILVACLVVVLLGCSDIGAHVDEWRAIGVGCDGADHKAVVACLAANHGETDPDLARELDAVGIESDRALFVEALIHINDPEISEAAHGIAVNAGIKSNPLSDLERWQHDYELAAPPTRARKHDEFVSKPEPKSPFPMALTPDFK